MGKDSGDPDAQTTVAVGLIAAVVIFLLIVALQALFFRVEEEEVRRKNEVAPEELTRINAKDEEDLNTVRWIDKEEGRVAIPIERAMELMVEKGRTSDTLSLEELQ